MKFSNNTKFNNLLCKIEEQIKKDEKWETEIVRFYKEFPMFPDYNYVSYGNLLISYHDVRELFESCGYTSTKNITDEEIWELYKSQVGHVIRELIKCNCH